MEKRAKNKTRVPRRVWGTFSEEERIHYNKLYDYICLHQEAFLDTKVGVEEWRRMARKIAGVSAEILRRGKLTGYADERSKFPNK